jgi:hypothetical protein
MGSCGERVFGSERLRRWSMRRIEEPEPRLWCGSLNSSWSVPPLCEYRSATALRNHFSNIKSRLNWERPIFRFAVLNFARKGKLWKNLARL